LFDLIDESETFEVDGVDVANYKKVVDQCYMCNLCYLTKCPYVPQHEWNVDFPHLMLKAEAINYKKGELKLRDSLITSTDLIGKVASMPVINTLVNSGNKNATIRSMLDSTLGSHKDAALPGYARQTARKKHTEKIFDPSKINTKLESTKGTDANSKFEKVTLFTTCYCNYNEPSIADSVIRIHEHSGVTLELAAKEHCAGMPKYELGDLDTVKRLKELNIPTLYETVKQGNIIIAAVPSCVLIFKQELPLIFPDDEEEQAVANAFFDPFEYLQKLHKENRLNLDFKTSLGNISYHVACHQRVQNIGPKTKKF
jgi:glycerol-3-phosphate dehydrogenase subunit C